MVLHVRMWDKENVLQQQALGIVGVNLIYGACYYHQDPRKLIASLLDNLSSDRIEVDMLRFSGPAFAEVDNRLMSLHLVNCGLTNAVMFGPKGDVLQPSEVLYKMAILVERGSFRPVTHVNVDMLNCATAQFIQEPAVKGKDVVVLMEITMNNLLAAGELDARDFLARVDILGDIGFTVLISNYPEYYRLGSYFRRYTKEMIGVAMGINNLLEIFNEKYYENLEGGILESFGRLFRHSVKLYIYPMRKDAYERYLAAAPGAPTTTVMGGGHAFSANVLVHARNVHVSPHLQNLYPTSSRTTTWTASWATIPTSSASSPATSSVASRRTIPPVRTWSRPRWPRPSRPAPSSATRRPPPRSKRTGRAASARRPCLRDRMRSPPNR